MIPPQDYVANYTKHLIDLSSTRAVPAAGSASTQAFRPLEVRARTPPTADAVGAAVSDARLVRNSSPSTVTGHSFLEKYC
jgi:hypothetical protein